MEAQQGGRIERERIGQREGRGHFPELMGRFGQRFPSDLSFFPPNSRQRISGLGFRSRQQGQNVELVGFTGGVIRDIFVRSNYAYCASSSGLLIFDVSNPLNPQLIGKLLLSNRSWDIHVLGNYAYMAADWSGLRIIDISNPTNPKEVGYHHIPGAAYGIYVSGNYAYIAAERAGLRIIDVSNPANPREVGFFEIPSWARDIYVLGDYAYMTGIWGGLMVIDVSNPINPKRVGYLDTPYYGNSIYVSGSYAYIADGWFGLRIIDVSDPTNPREVGYYDTPGFAMDISISGNYAYVADWNSGLRIIDISNPINPKEIGCYNTPKITTNVYVLGNYAYVTDYYEGLRIIDISDLTNLREIGYFDTPGYVNGIFVLRNYAYVTSAVGLRVIDISNHKNLIKVGSFDTLDFINDIHILGNYAYIAADDAGLRIIDVSNPTNLREVGYFDTPGHAYGVYILGSYAYVADAGTGLRIIDVSDPTNPREIGYFNTSGATYSVYVLGDYAYIADGTLGLRIIDVSNPTNPREVGYLDTPDYAKDVYVIGNYAYIADWDAGLRIIDVSDPTNPREVGYYDTPGIATSIYVSGSYAYVADLWSGLRIIDVSDPRNPREVGYFDTPGYVDGVYVSGSYIYIADGDGGLIVLRYTGMLPISVPLIKPGLRLVACPVIGPADPKLVFAFDENKWAWYDPTISDYRYYPDPATNLQVGKGYWAKFVQDTKPNAEGDLPDTNQPFSVALKKGWNMIGNPWLVDLVWDLSSIKVKVGEQEKALKDLLKGEGVKPYAWRWDGSSYRLIFDQSVIPGIGNVLPSWEGAWVYANTDCELILPPPSQSKGRGTRGEGRVAKGNSWSMRLQASVNGSVGEAVMGIANGTRGLAVGLPPEPPTGNNGVQVILLKNNTPLAVDVRSDGARRQEWEVLVRFGTRDGGRGTSERKEVVLTFDGIGYAPKDVSAWLVDTVTGKRLYLRTQPSYRFVAQEGEVERKFKVVVERGNDRPLRVVGLKATPMRGQGVVIEFILTKPAKVEAEVLTLTGRRVAILDAGSSEGLTRRIVWRGVGIEGQRVGSGVYLVRVRAVDEEGREVQAATVVRLK
jgi:hypothetical protein